MCYTLDPLLELFLVASNSALPWKIPIRPGLGLHEHCTATSKNHGHDAKHDAASLLGSPSSSAANFYFGSFSTTNVPTPSQIATN